MKTALSIAGSDSSGGAGIQADLKTMTMNGVYAMSAITALTAQNTTGVSAILDVTPHFLQQQIDAVFTDIPPDAVKIGMVSSAPLIQTIARCLRTYQAANIVVDPVMVATSGARLLDEDAVETLTQTLLPLADLLTPNLPEAEVLSGCSIQTEADMVTAARRISQTYHCAVLCKGGHSVNDANDLLYADGTLQCHRGQPGQRVFPAPGGTAGQGLRLPGPGRYAGPGTGFRSPAPRFCPLRHMGPGGSAACPLTRFPLCFFPLLAATGQIHYAERRNTRRLLSMFQENLKNYRKAKGLTQEDLAVRLHVVRQTISKWEKGLSVPDAALLVRLSEVLEVPVSQLLGAPLPPESSTNQVAEQLARINEQLAQKNRRARRIWQVVVGILLAFVLLWGILCLLSYHSYTQYVSPPKIQVEPLSSIPVERRCSDAVA